MIRQGRFVRTLVGAVASTLLMGLAPVTPVHAAEEGRSRHGRGCRAAVTALPDLGFGGNAVDLTRSGIYAGYAYTAARNVDVTGDGEPDPNRRASLWINRHRLTVPSGFAWDQVQDITSNLWVLGFGYDPASKVERSYVWRPGWRAVRILADPAGANSTRARKINDWGAIVGSASGPDIAPAAVYWRTYRTAPQILPVGPGGLAGHGTGINNRGQIVGYVADRDPDYGPDWFDFDATLWPSRRATAPVRLPDRSFDAEAVTINDRGQILGYVMTATAASPPEDIVLHPALWRHGRLRFLTTPPETYDPRMFGLSRRGWVVGAALRGSERVPPFNNPVVHALLSTDQRVLRVLPDLTDSDDPLRWNALASGVNDRRNEVVGWAFDGTLAKAAVWTCASRQAVDLTSP